VQAGKSRPSIFAARRGVCRRSSSLVANDSDAAVSVDCGDEPESLLFHAAGEGRILVADDNADMRDHVRRLLASRWQVETVASGRAALDAIQKSKPDLVLMDVMMPILDGFGPCARYARHPRPAICR
jgi:PleD family two-component response regulator